MPQDREKQSSTTSAGIDSTRTTDSASSSDTSGEETTLDPLANKDDGSQTSTTSAGLK